MAHEINKLALAGVLLLFPATTHGQSLEDMVITPHRHIGSLNITNKEQIDCGYIAGREPFVLFAAGQSLVANANGDYPWQKVTPQNVYEQWGGLCYKANAPLYGASDSRQSFVLPLADMIARGTGRDVAIIVAAVGSTSADEFLSGPARNLLDTQISNMQAAGLKPDVVIWEHGQSDRFEPGGYAEKVMQIDKIFRDAGVLAPVFVPVDSMFEWRVIPELQQAQKSLWDQPGVEAGPNIDLVMFRMDGTHLDQEGLEQQAAMWFQVLAAHFGW